MKNSLAEVCLIGPLVISYLHHSISLSIRGVKLNQMQKKVYNIYFNP